MRLEHATLAPRRRRLRRGAAEDAERLLRRLSESSGFDNRPVSPKLIGELRALFDEFLIDLANRRRTSRACFALGRHVEIENLGKLFLRFLSSAYASPEEWQWPVRIYTLGQFELHANGDRLRFKGKAQRKPLALAKALVAFGGQHVAAERLIDILWPEPSEGDGQKAFEITVHRLRKLLGSDQAVRVTDRRATLDPGVVWVDAWALEHTLAPLIAPVNASEPEIGLLEAAVPRVLSLYRGHFLTGDTEEAWQIPIKNRLAGHFQRFVFRLGEYWESRQQWRRAFELYARAVELDPLAESFYRRQMICLQAEGQRAEAMEVFRRCRQALSVMLGVAPTDETNAVYRQLVASASATRVLGQRLCPGLESPTAINLQSVGEP